MVFESITRLRIRSLRFLPQFFIHTMRTRWQTKRAIGFLDGSLLADRKRTFWTMTLWRDQDDMRAYMTSGAHLKAMPKLLDWYDEVSVVHWTQDQLIAPDWLEADRRMREEGRASKVRDPSSTHRNLAYDPSRTAGTVPIKAIKSV